MAARGHRPDVPVHGGVVWPAFDDVNDEQAGAVIAGCVPGLDILQIDAVDIVHGGGGIH